MLLSPAQLHDILSSYKAEVANAYLYQNEIKISNYINKIEIHSMQEAMKDYVDISDHLDKMKTDKKCTWLLVAKETNTYKIVSCHGIIANVSSRKLKALINTNQIANCRLEDNKFISTDTYEIMPNKEFENTIAEKYKVFQAKALMLGYGNISFEYEIENKQVKIRTYTGSSSNIILPSFITVIMKDAFHSVNTETLELNEGLKLIGVGAFVAPNKIIQLRFIEIPSTVELIEPKAFSFNYNKSIQEDVTKNVGFKLRNDKTIILRPNEARGWGEA